MICEIVTVLVGMAYACGFVYLVWSMIAGPPFLPRKPKN